jgi:hypothetical protein
VLSVHVDEDLGEICTQDEETQYCTEGKECEEISVVSASDAIVDPNTMVVLGLDTVVANSTVVTSRRTPDVASFAVFGWHFHSSGGRLCGLDHGPIVRWGCQSKRVFVLVRRRHWMKISRKNLAKLVGN